MLIQTFKLSYTFSLGLHWWPNWSKFRNAVISERICRNQTNKYINTIVVNKLIVLIYVLSHGHKCT